MSGFHIVTDLDGTWLPGPGQGSQLRDLEDALSARPDVALTFATGRTFTSALEAIDRWNLRPPHYLITDVGTAIFHRTLEGAWAEDQVWANKVEASWDRLAAKRLLREGLPGSVCPQPGVIPIRRLALQVLIGRDHATAERELECACTATGLSADILASHGLYFDVLPRGVHKGAAVAFLQASQNLPRPVVGCGDSANDLGLLEASDHPIVMLGGLEDQEAPAALIRRAHRTEVPGPQGIHRALVAFGLLKEGPHGH
jgi:hydroxymethylpyrimidine pyrophosphatase-like HAD family hydrolase